MGNYVSAVSHINWVDQEDCELTATPVVDRMEASNVAIYHLGDVWRGSDLASSSNEITLTGTFGSDRQVDRVAFWLPERRDDASDIDFEPSLTAADLVRWELSPDVNTRGSLAAGGVDTNFVASGIDPYWGVHDKAVALANCRRFDLTIRFATPKVAPFDQFDIGRVWLGPAFRFAVNFDYGNAWEPDEDEYANPIRRWQFQWSHIRESERPALEQLLFTTRKRRQILLIPKWGTENGAAFTRRTSAARISTRHFRAQQLPLTFQEDVAGD